MQYSPKGNFYNMQSHEGPPKPNEEGKLQERKRLIDLSRSVIPACDVSDLDSLEKIVK